MVNVNFVKLDVAATVPVKAHVSDVGFDLSAVTAEEHENYIEYGTGVSIQLPKGYYALLMPRSSVSKKDLVMCNSVGLIDNGYTGELKFRFKVTPRFEEVEKTALGFIKYTTLQRKKPNVYSVGDLVGQVVVLPYPEVAFAEVAQLEATDRGADGFGSTDTKPKAKRSHKKKTSDVQSN
jgi:dUTP pyrophosphatase